MEKEFTELLHQNQGIVHKICNLYFYNRIEKEDYKQELIIQLWKAFPTFLQQSKFSTWMYRVCLNAAIDIIRKEKSQPHYVKIEGHGVNNIPDDKVDINLYQENLYHVISRLSEVDKAIITLYLEEFSYKEIAEIMGISENNTGVKINRIKSLIIKSFDNGNK
jgi:RNA polymerase sigma-70 factor, ECF subfamily